MRRNLERGDKSCSENGTPTEERAYLYLVAALRDVIESDRLFWIQNKGSFLGVGAGLAFVKHRGEPAIG